MKRPPVVLLATYKGFRWRPSRAERFDAFVWHHHRGLTWAGLVLAAAATAAAVALVV